MKLCFCADSTQKKNDEAFGKLLIAKDGSPAARIDEEIKTRKFMLETKNFQKDLVNFLLLLDVRSRKIVV